MLPFELRALEALLATAMSEQRGGLCRLMRTCASAFGKIGLRKRALALVRTAAAHEGMERSMARELAEARAAAFARESGELEAEADQARTGGEDDGEGGASVDEIGIEMQGGGDLGTRNVHGKDGVRIQGTDTSGGGAAGARSTPSKQSMQPTLLTPSRPRTSRWEDEAVLLTDATGADGSAGVEMPTAPSAAALAALANAKRSVEKFVSKGKSVVDTLDDLLEDEQDVDRLSFSAHARLEAVLAVQRRVLALPPDMAEQMERDTEMPGGAGGGSVGGRHNTAPSGAASTCVTEPDVEGGGRRMHP